MKKIIIKMSSAVLIAVLLFGSNVFAASSNRETLHLSSNLAWNNGVTVQRSLEYSYGDVRCYAVYPSNGGLDRFFRVRAKIVLVNNTTVSDVYTISENATTSTQIKMKEGYLDIVNIKFSFSGNTSSAVYADVYYNAN